MFETKRIILRPFRDGDLDHLLDIWNEPEVQRGTTNDYLVPRSPKFKETLHAYVDKTLFYVIITLKETGQFMGNLTISVTNQKNRDGLLGITISKKYWGNGYGKEVLLFVLDYAFKALALHRVSLAVFESNIRAVRLYTNLGFKEEGRVRKGVWIEGAWQDVIHMGILEEEWAEQYRKADVVATG